MRDNGFATGALAASILFATRAHAATPLVGGGIALPSGIVDGLAGPASGGLPQVALDMTSALAPLAWAGLLVFVVTCLGLVLSTTVRRARRSVSQGATPAAAARSGFRDAA